MKAFNPEAEATLHLRDSLRKSGTETPAAPSGTALSMSSGDLDMKNDSSCPAENCLGDTETMVMALAWKARGSCWTFASEGRSSQCTVFSRSDGFLCNS